MKKVTALFFLCFLIVISFYNNKDNEETILANYIDDDSHRKIYLKFNDNFLNTKNFYNYFNEETKIISFYILKNKKNCMHGTNRYLFRFNDLENNIEGYKNFYSKLYKTNSYEYFNGIPISIVEVDIDTRSINHILNKNIKYSNDICGNYQ